MPHQSRAGRPYAAVYPRRPSPQRQRPRIDLSDATGFVIGVVEIENKHNKLKRQKRIFFVSAFYRINKDTQFLDVIPKLFFENK